MRKRAPAPAKRPARYDAIMAFIAAYVAERGYAPSIREIANACGISSTSLVNKYLNALQERGLLKRTRNVSRSIVLVKEDR